MEPKILRDLDSLGASACAQEEEDCSAIDVEVDRVEAVAADPVVWPGCVYAWLCTWQEWRGSRVAGPPARIGESAHPVNGCPQRILLRNTWP
jgi:hypothetical protein